MSVETERTTAPQLRGAGHQHADVGKAEHETLRHAIEHAAHLLPAQGPITVFIHHNTLHALEDRTFAEAVVAGSRIFGCRPYLPESQYRAHLARGRIRHADLEAILRDELGEAADECVLGTTTRLALRMAMLEHVLETGSTAELKWYMAETEALRRFRSDVSEETRSQYMESTRHWIMRDIRDGNAGSSQRSAAPRRTASERHTQRIYASLSERFDLARIETWSDSVWEAFSLQLLWRICHESARALKPRMRGTSAGPSVRHRDLLWEATGHDVDLPVHDLLIRFCAAFLDQGFAVSPLPRRDDGFYRAFLAMYSDGVNPPDRLLRGLRDELRRLDANAITALASIQESLASLGIPPDEWDSFLGATFLALRGWGGMIRQVAIRADSVARPIGTDSLLEFLAIRLVLERLAITDLARRELGYTGPLNQLRDLLRKQLQQAEPARTEQRAFTLFQLAQILNWRPHPLMSLGKAEWRLIADEVEQFGELERRRVFHLAYERQYRNQTLDAISLHRGSRPVRDTPRFQAVFCIDEREESLRRHLEEIAPEIETFGAAGFFCVAMYYRGAADAHFVPLCPIVIRPGHWVVEEVEEEEISTHERRGQTRRVLGHAVHGAHRGSRTFAGGALLAAGLGILASIPLVARVLFPRWTARLRHNASRLIRPPARTRLRIERGEEKPGQTGDQIGFTVTEMTNISERLLRDIGLTGNFAKVVLIVGHGSSSLNNPHGSAYDCGACGGSMGGPNSRAIAMILNDPRVRAELEKRQLRIPDETWFVGGVHNTCNDSVLVFDADRVPVSHREEFSLLERYVEEACDRNAHERCRRFESAPFTLSPSEARRHVQARSEDLAQTRPELGHATNAICFVGRRERTRGLFLDRRAFLVSYDPRQDDAQRAVLTRILSAVLPVCGGINLEYYFSHTDSTGWGCGTKLPHNVTSLLGVMDGAASDLRTGLPWQMVEIHEAIRLLFIIEGTPAAMNALMDRHPEIGNGFRNGWVQLAMLDPDSSALHVLRGGEFRRYEIENPLLPDAESSVDWYRGWRDHLEPARIGVWRNRDASFGLGTDE